MYFLKVNSDVNNKIYVLLRKKPLLLSIFLECGMRARRVQSVSDRGLGQGEFFLSENEFLKWGLKKSQRGQIRRCLLELAKLKLIQKTGKVDGDSKAIIYVLVNFDYIDPNFVGREGKQKGSTEIKVDELYIKDKKEDYFSKFNKKGSNLSAKEITANSSDEEVVIFFIAMKQQGKEVKKYVDVLGTERYTKLLSSAKEQTLLNFYEQHGTKH